MPYITGQIPAALLQQARPIACNDPGVRIKGIFFPAQRKILIFFKTVPGYDRDCNIRITLLWNKQQHNYRLRWGYGLYPAYLMKENEYFVIELALPGSWRWLDTVQINIDTFKRPEQKE